MSRYRTIEILANGARHSRRRGPGWCRSCRARIFWVATEAGKPLAFNVVPEVLELNGDVETVSTEHVHFSTCPQGRDWSRRT